LYGELRQVLRKPPNDKEEPPFHELTTNALWNHYYSDVYALHLIPYVRQKREHSLAKKTMKMKFLEIGIADCDMRLVPTNGLWRQLFDENDEIWEASLDAKKCSTEQVRTTKTIKKETNEAFHAAGGVRNDETTAVVQDWMQLTGGDFDIVVDHRRRPNRSDKDDGSRRRILAFEAIWPEIVPGGFYVFQDLHLSRKDGVVDKEGSRVIDYIYSLLEQLVISEKGTRSAAIVKNHRMPKNMHSVHCYERACVIEKCSKFAESAVQFCSWNENGGNENQFSRNI
jgi:hypothetical protein